MEEGCILVSIFKDLSSHQLVIDSGSGLYYIFNVLRKICKEMCEQERRD
jgi:hypothetical protein